MFFQPAFIFPYLEQYQPLKNFALIALILFIISKKKTKIFILHDRINICFFMFAIFQILSSTQIWLTGAWVTLNWWLRIGIIYYLIVKSGTNLNRVISLILVIVLSLVYLSFFSIQGYYTNYSPGLRAGGYGLYEYSNDLVIILVCAIPLVLCLSYLTKNFLIRIFFLSIAAFFSFNILLAGSRNGLLGLAIVGILSLFCMQKISGFLRIIFSIILILMVISVGVSNVLKRTDLNSSLTGDDSSENRIRQWKSGIRMLLAKPILGVGPEEFNSNAQYYGGIRGLAAHNTLIQTYAETGLIGGVFFTFFTVLPFYYAIRFLNKTRTFIEHRSLIVLKLLLVSLIGFWICAFFSNRTHFYILYVIIALIVAIKNNVILQKADVV